MRIIDEYGKEITNPDLSQGYTVETVIIKPDATPIDDKTKFAWDDDDYETVLIYYGDQRLSIINDELIELKEKLKATDYVGNKFMDKLINCDDIMAMLDTISRFKEDYGSVISARTAWRNKINELETELATLDNSTL